MDHFEAHVALAHVAENADAVAGRQRLLLAGIEREKAQDQLRIAPRWIGHQAHELSARPVLDVGVHDFAFGLN